MLFLVHSWDSGTMDGHHGLIFMEELWFIDHIFCHLATTPINKNVFYHCSFQGPKWLGFLFRVSLD